MGKETLTVVLLCGVLPYSFCSSAQDASPVSEFVKNSINKAREIYRPVIGINSGIYNGTEYPGYFFRIQGFPYFGSAQMVKGDIYYDGVLYRDIPFAYDLVSDDIVIKDISGNYSIRLIAEKVDYFSLLGHTFLRVTEEDNGSGALNGFYDRVYYGGITVLVKRKKYESHSSFSDDIISQFTSQSEYYILKDERLSWIPSKRSLIALFPGKRNEILRFMKTNKLNFRKDTENTIIKTAKYYDSLQHSE